MSCKPRVIALVLLLTGWPRSLLLAEAPIPPSADIATVDQLVTQLGSPDVDMQDSAEAAIDDLPWGSFPLLQVSAKAQTLPADAKARFLRVSKRCEGRFKLIRHRLTIQHDAIQWVADAAVYDYGHDGHADAKWDPAANKALELFRTGRLNADPSLLTECVRQVDAAASAGCDDPVLLAIAGLSMEDLGAEPNDQPLAYYARAADSIITTKTNPYFKALIDVRLLVAHGDGYDGGTTAKGRPAIKNLGMDLTKQIHTLLKTKEVPVHILARLEKDTVYAVPTSHSNEKLVMDDILPPLEKLAGDDPLVLCVKGQFYTDYAWIARGGGLGGPATPQAAKDFSDRLKIAGDALNKAWQTDPQDPLPADLMINVELGQGNGTDSMETWFHRAMDLNPDDWPACHSKLNYLQPRWYGTSEALLKFGQECAATNNWHGRLPLLLADAHLMIAAADPDPAKYLAKPAVWDDVQRVYTHYLKLHPNANWQRSKYANLACKCQQWKPAEQLFTELGDHLVTGAFKSPEELDADRQMADDLGKSPGL